MLERLDSIEEKYEELTRQLSDHELLADQSKYTKIAKQHRDLEEIVAKCREFKALDRGIRETKELLEAEQDAEMVNLARAELAELEQRREAVDEIRFCFCPKIPTMKRMSSWKC
jgi:peptide chain release factor 1